MTTNRLYSEQDLDDLMEHWRRAAPSGQYYLALRQVHAERDEARAELAEATRTLADAALKDGESQAALAKILEWALPEPEDLGRSDGKRLQICRVCDRVKANFDGKPDGWWWVGNPESHQDWCPVKSATEPKEKA